ncbi:MAG: hypothetical protein KJO98_15895 [Rhodothermia bacterium]|nr:hypothetical protein [Rhodothermia bacterium]
MNRVLTFLPIVLAALVLGACDSDITGSRLDNLPPDTQLSVRDTSLTDNLGDDERLTSTVFVSWTGDDPDGFVASFEFRFFPPDSAPAKEEAWSLTTNSDSLILLPIPPGEKEANVVFEVRAIDNDGSADPSPARTVFPIQNSPPDIAFRPFDLSPDTTFAVFSFGWTASDPEGLENLDRIDVSLNDSLQFVSLPPETEFVTFVGDVDKGDPGQTTTDARVFLGRGFQTSGLSVSGLVLGAENTIYIRAVDRTDTTSTVESFSWYVKKSRGEVLYVNDYRKSTFPTVQRFHLALLREYLPDGTGIDLWDISTPFVSGNAGDTPRSPLMPPSPDPTLRQWLADYSYIYWVATSTTASVSADNLPFVASASDLFFENGGKMMVHSPITLPSNPEDIVGNPALLLLPLSDLISFPDTLRPALRMGVGAEIPAADAVPGLGVTLPALESNAFLTNTLPYATDGANVIPLATGEYTYISRDGRRQGPWFGPSVIASLSADQRVGLFALPLINEQSGAQNFVGADGDSEAPRTAIKMMLESLGFPMR